MDEEASAQAPTIDALAVAAQHGSQSQHDTLVNAFVEAVVVVPSFTDPSTGPFRPVILDVDGTPHMLVCDTLDAARAAAGDARYAVSMRGADAVRGAPADHAILVRTENTGFAIDRALLDEIRQRLAS